MKYFCRPAEASRAKFFHYTISAEIADGNRGIKEKLLDTEEQGHTHEPQFIHLGCLMEETQQLAPKPPHTSPQNSKQGEACSIQHGERQKC